MTAEIQPASEVDLERAPFTWKTLQAIAATEFVPAPLRGNVPALLACILTGRELGIGPMESLRAIDIIDGRPTPSGEWMVGRILEAGHLIFAESQTDEACTVTGVRREDGVEVARMSFTFTTGMAQRANLLGKSNWKRYPEAMLYWRAVSQLARQFFPDVLHGIKYLPEELGDDQWTETPYGVSVNDAGEWEVTDEPDDVSEEPPRRDWFDKEDDQSDGTEPFVLASEDHTKGQES